MSLFQREIKKRTSVVVSVPPVVKKSSKSRSFYFRYLELCRAKNITPVPEIRSNSNGNTFLDLLGDKLGVSEWLLIIDALHHDLVLQTMVIRMRRTNGNNIVLPIDTENRARLFRQKPVVYTRFIFNSLVEAIANCVQHNKNLTVLKLEGLPLQDGYIDRIAQSLASNDCLKEISFQKSYIGDKGCEAVCSTVKYLNHVEIFNISECNISAKGAEFVADMIKMQKITRFSEGWEKSLRYRSVDVNSISGLRNISLANNPELGDNGLRPIAEVLKEDAWVKSIDMENCGLTDCGANIILECLSFKNAIAEFNVRHNEGISKFLMRQIRDHFGKEDEEKMMEPKFDLSSVAGLHSLPKSQKYSVYQLLAHTKTLEEQLSLERTLRKKAEKLNEKLNQQLMSMDHGVPSPPHPLPSEKMESTVPMGYVLVKNDFMQSFTKEYTNPTPAAGHVNQLVNSTVTSSDSTPRSANTTLRKTQKIREPESPQRGFLEQDYEGCQEEEQEEDGARHVADINQQMRQQLHVRKVRSEMKYVEKFSKDNAKKRESKSDHEFANERDFKLNPNVQFEADIGDSVLVNEQQMERKRSQAREDGDYYEQEIVQKLQNNAQFEAEFIGDCVRNDDRKQISKIRKQYSDVGNSQMALYMAELERKITSNSGKKQQKSKQGANESKRKPKQSEHFMQVDTYIANMEDNSSVTIGSESDEEEYASSTNGQTETTVPMKVFLRRTKHYEEEEEQVELRDEKDTEEHILSPRSVYLEMQRKMSEKND